MKRVKVIKENPNGLFLQWLAEFREEAREKGNSGLIKVYKMCIENLSKYVFFYQLPWVNCDVFLGTRFRSRMVCSVKSSKVLGTQSAGDWTLS